MILIGGLMRRCRPQLMLGTVARAMTTGMAQPGFVVSPEVEAALRTPGGGGIVALESTIISHGMPYPQNVHTAREVEEVVRAQGAVPATIAILDGVVHIGLTPAQLETLGRLGPEGHVDKCSRRDIARVVAQGKHGATTVAGTLALATAFGHIDVFVTGGIGGVHRDVGDSLDVSADLTELGRSPLLVVCAGVKSILDIPRTLEYLETEGVAVFGYKTNHFPAFFTASSGTPPILAPLRMDSTAECANWVAANKRLGLSSGAVIAVPNPAPVGDAAFVQSMVDQALEEARQNGVVGKDTTPFLLRRVNELTGGDSLLSNIALVKHNAQIGGQIAARVGVPATEPSATLSSAAAPTAHAGDSKPIVVLGGATVDIVGQPCAGLSLGARTSTPGRVVMSYGGVGRNIAETLGRLGTPTLIFGSAVGDDAFGSSIKGSLEAVGVDTSFVETHDADTAVYEAVLDEHGDLDSAIAAMDIMGALDQPFVDRVLGAMPDAPALVVLDGNLMTRVLQYACDVAASKGATLWFEPTSVEKAKVVGENPAILSRLTYMSPNEDELQAIYTAATGNAACSLEEMGEHVLEMMCADDGDDKYIILTMGGEGVYLMRGQREAGRSHLAVTMHRMPADQTDMVNCTGAGDTLVGTTVAALATGRFSISESVQAGMRAARLSVGSAHPVSDRITSDLLPMV